MENPKILRPAPGSRVVTDSNEIILFGQPPEVLKGLLRQGITRFDTLVLTDIREKDGSLLNNLEFPFYFFLFYGKGFQEKRKINLVGDNETISHALRLLRFTLFGPTRKELEEWQTEPALRDEWLAISDFLALKDNDKTLIPIENFFNIIPYRDNVAIAGSFTITRSNLDLFDVSNRAGTVTVDLNSDQIVQPPYSVATDHNSGGLAKFGLDVLGGASGFAANEPCTGLAMCHNGDYILIDSIPFLDNHLHARGIAQNQIQAVFLTHLHDDHCSMFPLMNMPHRIEVITTREIFNMAMEKLSCGLGWQKSVIEEHFTFFEVHPGDRINYYGLNIDVHATVHSIPTIGATFSAIHHGQFRDVCIVGDNQNMKAVREMNRAGIVRDCTVENLDRLYKQKFHILIADGGAGDIHGDPFDALESKSERVVFVHVEKLPDALNTRFTLASSGKRYTLFEGDDTIYISQINQYLNQWLGHPFPTRWLRSLLTEHEIYRYNTEDVIVMQDADRPTHVSLILTGYCEVVRNNGNGLEKIAMLQAGDVIGDMGSAVTLGPNGVSVVARTPVTVCVFDKLNFYNFIDSSNLRETLELRWRMRPYIKSLPQYSQLSSTVVDKISRIAEWQPLAAGEKTTMFDSKLYVLSEGEGMYDGNACQPGDEFGSRIFCDNQTGEFHAITDCGFIIFEAETYRQLLQSTPQLHYQVRKQVSVESPQRANWLLPAVEVY
jgi:CRP-like cAMP-binding protein